jgi:hypothetical protein
MQDMLPSLQEPMARECLQIEDRMPQNDARSEAALLSSIQKLAELFVR